jgi:hypothetical protein
VVAVRVPAALTARGDWRSLLVYCLERDTLVRSAKTALVVGTLLALINHGQEMLAGGFSPRWVIPMLVTYLVPFSVASYGQIQGKRQRDRLRALAARQEAGDMGADGTPFVSGKTFMLGKS